MPNHPLIHSADQQYILVRCNEIAASLRKCWLEEPSMDFIFQVFHSVLDSQNKEGAWPDNKGPWTCVQTSLALNTLARLGFTQSSSWPMTNGVRGSKGSIHKALEFIETHVDDLDPTQLPNKYTQDIWDVCQVMLALAAFESTKVSAPIVAKIASDWESIYSTALRPDRPDRNGWAGPAFLAAMIETVWKYKGLNPLPPMLERLLAQENDSEGSAFIWRKSSEAEACWHASLVLRLLCQQPGELIGKDKRRDLINNIVLALLKERYNANPHWGKNYCPMYTARALAALAQARPFARRTLVDEIDEAVRRANLYLTTLSVTNEKAPYPMQNLKDTLAVAEYLASLTVKVPIGTALEGAVTLPIVAKAAQIAQGPMASLDCVRLVNNGLRLAWLSDLHIGKVDPDEPLTVKRCKLFRRAFTKQQNNWGEGFSEANFSVILDRLARLKPHHVLITGDISNLSLPEQFRRAYNLLLDAQSKLYPDDNYGGNLSQERWTILPGNHDVGNGGEDGRLNLFFKHFGETYPSYEPGSPFLFPLHKRLPSPILDPGFQIELVGLDSTPIAPVQAVGVNAKGRLHKSQLDRLANRLLEIVNTSVLRLVALHHHPLVIPYVKSRTYEYFMQLEPADAASLIDLCSDFKVHAVLHGHFHTYSTWFAPLGAPQRLTGIMPIIGAPCGTVNQPGKGIEFLELRECDVQTAAGLRRGLALYRQQCADAATSTWNETFQDVCLY